MTENLTREGLLRLCDDDSDTARAVGPRLEETVTLLERYMAEIELFNPAWGLVGAKDRRELTVRHILDSLSPLGCIVRLRAGENPAVCDIGSGAGLPGIPLAICLPETRFTLIERMGRRAGFLRNALAVLGLPNVEIEEKEMEKAAPARFGLGVFRAFRPLDPQVFRGIGRLLGRGGVIAAWKGRRDKARAELDALGPALAGRRAELLPCPVPFLDEERHLAVIWT